MRTDPDRRIMDFLASPHRVRKKEHTGDGCGKLKQLQETFRQLGAEGGKDGDLKPLQNQDTRRLLIDAISSSA
jgi:hypothetical protein